MKHPILTGATAAAATAAAVMLFASPAIAATTTSSANPAPSTAAATCDRTAWPSDVQGTPSFKAGDATGDYLWHNATGFHLRVTHPGHQRVVFTGEITSSSAMSVTPFKLEKGDIARLSANHKTLVFVFSDYGYVDGVNFTMRTGKSVEAVPVLAAIGVTDDGTKLVAGLQSGDKESATNWREFFRDLKSRGLDGSLVKLGIMDGLSGLEKVFKEEFSNAKVQRCQVHVARNVLAKVPHKLKQPIADDLRSIFYASSKEKAETFYKGFVERWDKEVPSAVKSLRQSIDSCLTFFSFPEEEWISLRTTNVIERLNKEFKRRTKSMEIVAGEDACYRLLAFISLKMELGWRIMKVGKVRPHLPLYQIYTK